MPEALSLALFEDLGCELHCSLVVSCLRHPMGDLNQYNKRKIDYSQYILVTLILMATDKYRFTWKTCSCVTFLHIE